MHKLQNHLNRGNWTVGVKKERLKTENREGWGNKRSMNKRDQTKTNKSKVPEVAGEPRKGCIVLHWENQGSQNFKQVKIIHSISSFMNIKASFFI